MTAKQIMIEIKKIYPSAYLDGPIHCIGQWHEGNYNKWEVETEVVPHQHRTIGEGRTPKKALVAAWENREKYIKLAGMAEAVKKAYPDAKWHYIPVEGSTWREVHVIGKIEKPYSECTEEDLLTVEGKLYNTPDEAWIAAYQKINEQP